MEKVKGGIVLDCIWITGFIWVLIEEFASFGQSFNLGQSFRIT